jgi:hypothetical protein
MGDKLHTYSQSSGKWFVNGEFFAQCYSGIGEGLNNPLMQEVHNVGPIPRGMFRIGDPYHHAHLGEDTMNLDPINGTNTFGRSDFRLHADLKGWPSKHIASHGCVIMIKKERLLVAASLDRMLEVVL